MLGKRLSGSRLNSFLVTTQVAVSLVLLMGTGLRLSLAASRILSSALFGLSAFDSLTFVGGSLLVAAVALPACYIPARKATRIEPTAALRYE